MPTLSERQLEMLGSGEHFAVVATVDASGRPQSSVVWIDTDGENVVFNTTNARAKGRNLRERPWVSISVIDRDDPNVFFEVQGRAELSEEGAAEHIHELSRRYVGRDFHTPFDRVIARAKPERIFDHGVDE
jgi:PPOX class probable F420-dependent enzyme